MKVGRESQWTIGTNAPIQGRRRQCAGINSTPLGHYIYDGVSAALTLVGRPITVPRTAAIYVDFPPSRAIHDATMVVPKIAICSIGLGRASAGHSLDTKLRAARAAGFDGLEVLCSEM